MLRPQRVFLVLLSSFVFYEFSGGTRQLAVLIIGICWVYFFSAIMETRRRPWLLVLSIGFPVLALIYFKYRHFLIYDLLFIGNGGGEASFSLFEKGLLPAGISFYTFQLISYAIDRYRGVQQKPKSLVHFGFYIAFFPQLVAGPILRYNQVSENLNRLTQYRLSAINASYAAVYFSLGFAFKVLIADTIDRSISPMTAAPGGIDGLSRIYVIMAYSNQIYFDFFGYSLMAMGIGRLFGFEFPMNFRMPYRSLNPREFWRCWHITLSYWIRDYLYMPLGGNRSYIRNILIVFLLCGLWHGAGWNFFLWGGIHGVVVVLYAMAEIRWNGTPVVVQWAATYIFVSLAWVLFLFDLPTAYDFFAGFVRQPFATETSPTFVMWLCVAAATLVALAADVEKICKTVLEEKRFGSLCAILCAGLLFLSLMFVDQSTGFIYFRF